MLLNLMGPKDFFIIVQSGLIKAIFKRVPDWLITGIIK